MSTLTCSVHHAEQPCLCGCTDHTNKQWLQSGLFPFYHYLKVMLTLQMPGKGGGYWVCYKLHHSLCNISLSLSYLCFFSSRQSADYRYRAAVRELVPQLRYLDNVRVEDDGLSYSGTMGEDWAILRNSIRDRSSSQRAAEDGVCMLLWVSHCKPVNYTGVFNGPFTFVFPEEIADSTGPFSRPSTARRPASSCSRVWPPSSACSRPHTGYRPMSAARPGVLSTPGSRPGSADSDLAAVEAETSVMTHG